MSNLAEVEEAVNSIKKTGNSNLILLHCVSNYPAAYEDLNLRAMVTLKEAFKLPTGYSDHSPGIEVPIAAVAMGAQVVEKHFTLDKNMEGPDHQASLTPTELNQMIKSIRNVETAIGDGIKKIQKREVEIKKVAQKSLKASRTIKIGEEINENNITIKRPADGLAPNFFERLDSNFVANKIIKKDENIKLENLKSKKGIDLNGIL
jgi:sialic acid synthase SpsE